MRKKAVLTRCIIWVWPIRPAHKWFNLAAMRGVDEAKSWRAQLAREMLPQQIAEAQRLAREWLSMFH